MSNRRTRRSKQNASQHAQQQKARPTENHEVVDAEIVEEKSAKPSEVARAQSVGSLGDLYTPSPLALLSPEAFTARINGLILEQQRIEEVKRAVLIHDANGDGSGDYGKIPGTKKDSLYQSGAEKFNRLFGLRPSYRRERVVGDGKTAPHIRYTTECDLVNQAGEVVGSGAGTCSTWEVKYRYRNAGLQCPECGATEIRVSKFEDSAGFYCWKKPEQGHDGCGARFAPHDQRITGQTVGRIDNPDPHDVENTVLQMSDKRAYVKATRTTHALSNTFTQDDGASGDDLRPEATDQRAAQAARNGAGTISEAQQKAIRDAMAAQAKKFDDCSALDVARDVGARFKVKSAADLREADVPDVMKFVFAWEPGGKSAP